MISTIENISEYNLIRFASLDLHLRLNSVDVCPTHVTQLPTSYIVIPLLRIARQHGHFTRGS